MATVEKLETGRRRKVLRSPNYPAFSLSDALEKARVIFAKEGRTPAAPNVLLEHLGYKFDSAKAPSGPSARALSALKQFGLLEERHNKYAISQAAFDLINLSDGSTDRIMAMKEAAAKPALFREIINFYKGNIPSDANLRDHLLKVHSFNPASVGYFIKTFRETMELAKSGDFSDNDPTEEELNDLPPMDSGTPKPQASGNPAVETPYFRFSLNGATVEFRASAPLSKEHFALIEAHLKALNPDKENGK